MPKALLLFALCAGLVCGQVEQAAIAIMGSQPHKYIFVQRLTPGELATLLVSGLSTDHVPRAGIVAEPGPLPFELAGIVVTMELPQHGFPPTPIPILRIDRSGCSYGYIYVCGVLAITVHIPPDMITRGNLGCLWCAQCFEYRNTVALEYKRNLEPIRLI